MTSVRFFLLALFFSSVSGFLGYVHQWLIMFRSLPIINIGFINFGLSLISMAVSVILPFFSFYHLRHEVEQPSTLKKSLLFTFFGCWIGQLFPYFTNLFVQFSLTGGSNIASWYWFALFWHIWWIILLAVSRIFFVIFAATFFGYYIKMMTSKRTQVGELNQ